MIEMFVVEKGHQCQGLDVSILILNSTISQNEHGKVQAPDIDVVSFKADVDGGFADNVASALLENPFVLQMLDMRRVLLLRLFTSLQMEGTCRCDGHQSTRICRAI